MSAHTAILKVTWQQAYQDTQNAWSTYCIHRALLWEFHIYDTIAKSCRDKLGKGTIPTEKFLVLFNTLRKRMIRRTAQLPEFEQWQDRYQEEKEAKLAYVHAVVQEGGGVIGGTKNC